MVPRNTTTGESHLCQVKPQALWKQPALPSRQNRRATAACRSRAISQDDVTKTVPTSGSGVYSSNNSHLSSSP